MKKRFRNMEKRKLKMESKSNGNVKSEGASNVPKRLVSVKYFYKANQSDGYSFIASNPNDDTDLIKIGKFIDEFAIINFQIQINKKDCIETCYQYIKDAKHSNKTYEMIESKSLSDQDILAMASIVYLSTIGEIKEDEYNGCKYSYEYSPKSVEQMDEFIKHLESLNTPNALITLIKK